MIKLIIGQQTNDVRVMCDGVDIGNALRIASLTIGPLRANEVTQCTMVVHTEAEIELLPEGVTVIVQDPASPAYDECPANGKSCNYGPYGPDQASQCEHCGRADPDTACTNCGKPSSVVAGVCSVECFEQIEAGDTPMHETAPKPYTGQVRKP